MNLLTLILAASLCGAEAHELLWSAAKQDQAPSQQVARSIVNWTAFTDQPSRDAFFSVLDDVRQIGGDINSGTFARALGRSGISPQAVAEYVEAVNYYRVDGRLIRGLIESAEPGTGATRNLVRIGSASTDAEAIGEMLEIVAMRRLGIRPDEVNSFGRKIDISAFQLGQQRLEADVLLEDRSFIDAKWTSAPTIGTDRIPQDHLQLLEDLLKSQQPAPPMSQALFVTNKPPDAQLTALIDEANARIRQARGLAEDGPQRFLDILVVGDLN